MEFRAATSRLEWDCLSGPCASGASASTLTSSPALTMLPARDDPWSMTGRNAWCSWPRCLPIPASSYTQSGVFVDPELRRQSRSDRPNRQAGWLRACLPVEPARLLPHKGLWRNRSGPASSEGSSTASDSPPGPMPRSPSHRGSTATTTCACTRTSATCLRSSGNSITVPFSSKPHNQVSGWRGNLIWSRCRHPGNPRDP